MQWEWEMSIINTAKEVRIMLTSDWLNVICDGCNYVPVEQQTGQHKSMQRLT